MYSYNLSRLTSNGSLVISITPESTVISLNTLYILY